MADETCLDHETMRMIERQTSNVDLDAALGSVMFVMDPMGDYDLGGYGSVEFSGYYQFADGERLYNPQGNWGNWTPDDRQAVMISFFTFCQRIIDAERDAE